MINSKHLLLILVGLVGTNCLGRPVCDSFSKEIIGGDTVHIKISCYDNGGWESSRTLKGVLEGKTEAFYSNGSKMRTAEYHKGKAVGTKMGWTKDGFLAVIRPYHNGIPIDTHKVWFDNKKQESITVYDSSGEKNGWCRNWYESDQLKDSTLFFHGNEREKYLYFPNGKLHYKCFTNPDGFIKTSDTFDSTGKSTGQVRNGNGREIFMNDDNTRDTLTIKDGKVVTPSHEFFKNR
jgi:antitoxin component YwqK of YwqJK toxin-antitoxin module